MRAKARFEMKEPDLLIFKSTELTLDGEPAQGVDLEFRRRKSDR
jgi:hypothetical protein